MQMAVNLARMRDIFKFYASFTGTVMVLGCIGAAKLKNPAPLIPSLPLSWVCAFQYGMYYILYIYIIIMIITHSNDILYCP